jgi:hypothetical protein
VRQQLFAFNISDLASRTNAKGYRLEIEKALLLDSSVVLDLKGVESISDSFADELFGILALNYGIEYISKNIRITNAKDSVLRDIAQNIDRRLPEPVAA